MHVIHRVSIHSDLMKCAFYLQVVCVLCMKLFSEPGLLRRHNKSVHLKMRFKCPLCDSTYNRKDNLTAHTKQKHCPKELNKS
jgi:uncharacterized Zn-finger protein